MHNQWFKFVLESNLYPESKVHSHIEGDDADQFHSWDGGTTEMEYLTFIHSLVLATKPNCVLETGTSAGIGTLAIAAALQVNHQGKVWTIDTRDVPAAHKLIRESGLSTHVEFVKGHSIPFLARANVRFDVAFFDSDHPIRRREYLLASQKDRLTSGALCLFHDSSLMRHNVPTDEGYLAWLSTLPRLEFPKSRGLTMFIHRPNNGFGLT